MFHVPEEYREKVGAMASDEGYGNNGLFYVPFKGVKRRVYQIIASDGMGWEHVSVTLKDTSTSGALYQVNRCPYWGEMCFVKKMFWDKKDTVIQYHPADENYINRHEFVLHLWRPIDVELPIPDPILVG